MNEITRNILVDVGIQYGMRLTTLKKYEGEGQTDKAI